MKINRVLIVALLVASMMSLVFMPRTVSARPRGYEHVVVAWDEEFAEHGYMMYVWSGGVVPLGEESYVDWQMSRALYWFHGTFGEYVEIDVIGSTSWDSDDSYYMCEALLEAEIETGFADGLYFDGVRATILIAFTGQNVDTLGGGCIPENKSMIIRHQEEWADDNVIMHELSHLWMDGHTTGQCVMSYEYTYMGFYNEPLQPDWGHIMLNINQKALWNYFAYEWSDEAKADMINDMTHDYPPPPDPWVEGLPPPLYHMRILTLIGIIAIVLGLVCLTYVIIKRLKKQPKIIKNKQSAIQLMTIPFLTVTAIDFLLKSVIGFYTFMVKDLYADFLDSGEFRIKESRDYTRKSPTHMYIRKHR